MPGTYKVQQGDCLSSIAKAFGFCDWHTIYDDPANEDFRELRPNPNVIYPGDKLVIPDKLTKVEPNRPTDQRHSFVRKSPKTWLRIKVGDGEKAAAANCRYHLEVDGVPFPDDVTDGVGMVVAKIPADARSGILTVWFNKEATAGRRWTLKIGHLDPVETATGIQSRLNNLGYPCGRPDGIIGPLTQAAVRSFQEDNGLDVDGIAGPIVQGKLKELHGS
jgi:N-acetylmuramoyl-L-alanine amidase